MANVINPEYRIWIKKVKEDAFEVKLAPFKLRLQKEFAIACCMTNGLCLEHFSDYQTDKDVVLTAVKQNGLSIEFANVDLRDDYEIAEAAISNNGLALEFLSDFKKFDREFVLKAIYKDYKAHDYDLLEDDEEIGVACVKSRKFKTVSDFMCLSQFFRENKTVALTAVRKNPEIYKVLIPELRAEKAIYKIALSKFGIIPELPDFVRDNEKIVLESTLKEDEYLIYASERLRKDKAFVKKVCEIRRDNFRHADEMLRDDKDFVLEFIPIICPLEFKYVSRRLRDDQDVVSAALRKNPICYKHASKRLRGNKDIFILFYTDTVSWCYPELVKFVPENLRYDKEVFEMVAKKDREEYWEIYGDRLP